MRQLRKDAIYIECLAIKGALVYWQYKLIGNEFVVLTDHKPLENLNVKVKIDTKLGKLIMYLSQFNFKIIYRSGKENVLADSLSRNPVLIEFDDDESIQTSNLILIQEIINDQNSNQSLKNNVNIKKEKDVFYNLQGEKK